MSRNLYKNSFIVSPSPRISMCRVSKIFSLFLFVLLIFSIIMMDETVSSQTPTLTPSPSPTFLTTPSPSPTPTPTITPTPPPYPYTTPTTTVTPTPLPTPTPSLTSHLISSHRFHNSCSFLSTSLTKSPQQHRPIQLTPTLGKQHFKIPAPRLPS